MPRKPSTPPLPRPTDSELSILRVLWKHGQSSVRSIYEALNARREEPLAYTTVLRFMQIMTEKKLVQRVEEGRAHFYLPAVPAEKTKRQMIGDLVDRLCGGSVQDLVLQALGSRKVSPKELKAIRKLLKEADGKNDE